MSDLPPSWEWVPLRSVAEVQLGRQRSPKNHSGANMKPYLRAANVTWSGLALDDVKEMNFSATEVERFRLHPGDILLSEASGSASEVGKPAIWRGEIEECCFQNTLLRVRAREADPEYLLWFFKWMALSGQFAKGSRGVGIHHLGAKALSEWTVPIAPQEEQKRVVEIIDEQFSCLDAGMTSIQRTRRSINRMRLSLLANACSGRLSVDWRGRNQPDETGSALLDKLTPERMHGTRKRPMQPVTPEPNLIPGLPRTWTHASIDQLCSLVTDGEHATPPRTPDGVMLLSARNIQNGFLSFDKVDYISEGTHESLARRLEIQSGDVLLSCSGSVGRSTVVPDGSRFSLVRSVAVLRPIRKSGHFISMMLRSPQLQAQINSRKTETAQANIFQKQIRSLTLPLPPEKEQEFIVRELESKLAALDRLEKELALQESRIAALRSSVLAAAFSGKLLDRKSIEVHV